MSRSTTSKKIHTVVIADDHPLILMGLEQALSNIENVTILAKEANGKAALEAILKHKPDIAICDIQMPEMNGLEIAEQLSSKEDSTYLVLLTMFHDLSLFEKAKQLNVKGYLLKDSMLDEIEVCISTILNGKEYLSQSMQSISNKIDAKLGELEALSRMEKKVFQLISEQKSSKEIANLLFLSPKTIDNHRYNICKKLNIGGGANALFKYAQEYKS